MSDKKNQKDSVQDLPAFRPWPSRLFVETTTRCNLNCVMCVKNTWDKSLMEGDMSEETFAVLEPAFPHLESLILNGVGEPLLDDRLERFIGRARRLMPRGSRIGFQSNGMLLDEERAVSLVQAGLDMICFSADALDPEKFRKIRRGGEEKGIERALSAMANARMACQRPDLRIGLEFVVMRENIGELPELLRRAASLGASFAIVTHVLPYVQESVSQTAFDANIDQAVELFKSWNAKAASEGLELSDYFKGLWKYMRKPTDQDLAELCMEISEYAGKAEGVAEVLGWLGAGLPSKQITIKSFSDTSQEVQKLIEEGGWMECLEQVFRALAKAMEEAPLDLARSLALVRASRDNPSASGPNLAECLILIWKYSRTPTEQRLGSLVEELNAEARSRGISLHLKNLMIRDEGWAAEMERIFSEARIVAAETGLSLTLPATAPSGSRRCDFIEEGSAFVSWNGNVHPCYFLWHQYGCHLFGRRKSVTPRIFGNVNERDILDIWNDARFREFREEVLRYDFPYCSNCNVVPCQFLMADEFEQDCFGNTVPCGDCFWCMGMFNCMR